MIDTRFSPEERKDRVTTLNHLIESLSKEEDVTEDLKKLTELTSYLDDRIKDVNDFRTENNDLGNIIPDVDTTISVIKKYEEGRKSFNSDKELNEDLKKSMKAYHENQKRIYSQDLPISTKNMMLKMSEEVNANADDVSLLKASIENHFINLTTEKQIDLQDVDLSKWISSVVLTPEDKEKVESFYKQPRVVLEALNQAKTNIKNSTLNDEEKKIVLLKLDNEIKRVTILLTTDPNKATASSTVQEIERMDPILKNILEATDDYQKIVTEMQNFDNARASFDKVFDSPLLQQAKRDPHEVDQLRNSILMHKNASLVQHSQEMIGQFEAPTLSDKKVSKNDLNAPLVIEADKFKQLETAVMKIVIDTIAKDSEFAKLSNENQSKVIQTMVMEEMLKRVLGEAGLERFKMEAESEKKHGEISEELKKYYEDHFDGANKIMEGIYDRAHLETSTMIHKGVLIADSAILATTVLGTILTPAAPVAATIGAGTSVAAAGVFATNIALNTMDSRNDSNKEGFNEATLASGEAERAMLRMATPEAEKIKKADQEERKKVEAEIAETLSQVMEDVKVIEEIEQEAEALDQDKKSNPVREVISPPVEAESQQRRPQAMTSMRTVDINKQKVEQGPHKDHKIDTQGPTFKKPVNK